METKTIHSIIKHSLPKVYWKEVISALKQEKIVWNALQSRKFIELLQEKNNSELEEWLPANLGLTHLGIPERAKDFQTSDSPLLEKDLFNEAMIQLEDAKEHKSVSNLEQAVLIALAMRERKCLGDSWPTIQKDFDNCYPSDISSVMVCLLGLVSNPNEFLGNFTFGNSQLDKYRIIIHTILSNPIGTNRQIDILVDLMMNRQNIFSPQPLDHLNAIQILSLRNPQLAAQFSYKLLDSNLDWQIYRNSGDTGNNNSLRDLEIQLLNSELVKFADSQGRQDNNNVLDIGTILNFLVELSISNPDIFSELKTIHANDGGKDKYLTDSIFHEKIFTNHPLYLENSLLQLLNRKDFEQAENFTREHRDEIPSKFLINCAMALTAYTKGELHESSSEAQNALDYLSENDAELAKILLNRYENVIYDFIKLLTDLDLQQEAISIIKKGLSISPRDVNLHLMMGEASLSQDSPDQAISGFYDAAMLEPDNLSIRKKLALSLERSGNWNEAYTERKHILEEVQNNNQPPDIADLHALAECAINLGYLEEALRLCERATSQYNENGYSHSLIGKVLIKQGETESAFEYFEKGIQLSPDIPDVWLALFEAQNEVGEQSGAIETLYAASQAIPESTEIHLALGELQLAQNALTEALTSFQKGAEINPLDNRIALKLGYTLKLLGHLDTAREVLEGAQQRKPDDPEIAYEYAKVLIESGEKRSALPLLNIVVDSNPGTPEPYLEYADLILAENYFLDDKNQLDKVVRIIKNLLEFDADNSIAHALLGESLTARGDFIEAKQAFQFALESDLVEEKDWFARLSLGMGRVALAIGQEDVALASLQEAVQTDPNNPQIHKVMCEVFQAVNLIDNALQSARSALNLAIDDVDTLSWYAEQMLHITERELDDNPELSSNEVMKQVQIEAINALQQAIQIAPEKAELVVKLGKLQSYFGDKSDAMKTLNSLIEKENADVNALTAAGRLLKNLGDNCGAIACLEKALSLSSDSSSLHSPMLLLDLANLYHYEEDHDSAIETLNKSIELYPTYAPIYSTKADILLNLKKVDEALDCALEGIERSPEDENQILLHLLASNIFRTMGNLSKALSHGIDGLSLIKINPKTPEKIISAIRDLIITTAELYRSILKPNRGRMLLKDMGRKIKIDFRNEIYYCCTYLELFIDSIEDAEMTSLISQIIERYPNHPRILALQSRILNHRGDYQTSLQILHGALDSTNQKDRNSKTNYKETDIDTLLIWYSLYESALGMNQWDTALFINRKILEMAPAEPRAYINLARLLVRQAEYQRLCEYAEITTHAPGDSALSPEARKEFDHAIFSASQYLPALEVDIANDDGNSSAKRINSIITRWQARGLAAFGSEEEIIQGVGDLVAYQKQADVKKPYLHSDDIASIISAEIRLGKNDDNVDFGNHIQPAAAFQLDSELRLQAAIAVSSTNPVEAIKILDQLNEKIRSKESPYRAIANACSAKIAARINQIEDAKVSIDAALEIWPNEPRWQILAADIYKKLGNINEVIHHFDEAILLEPNRLDYHLNLGKLLTEHADLDPTYTTRAIQTLERACRLEPNEPESWLYLSRAYLLAFDIEQALTCADMAITLSPDSHEPLLMRGEIALHQDEPMVALEYADHALEIKGQDIQAVLIKTQALKELGKANEALQVLESAMDDMDDPLSIHIEYALLLYDVRGPQASINALNALVEQNPDDPIILSMLARYMAEVGETDTAIQTAQRALQNINGDLQIKEKAELHYLLGKLLFQVRQLDQAIHHLSESIALTPNFVEPYLELGHAHQERRQFRQALDAYRKATQIAPNDYRPYYHAGIALKDGKDYQSSESMLRRAADLAPDDVNIRRQLAAVVALNLVHNPRPQRIVEE